MNGYEGRPTDYQMARAESLGHELDDVIADFRKLTDKELPAINADLKKKKMEAISVLSEADWQKQHEECSAKPAGAGSTRWISRELHPAGCLRHKITFLQRLPFGVPTSNDLYSTRERLPNAFSNRFCRVPRAGCGVAAKG